MFDNIDIGNRLKNARIEKQLNQNDVAKAVGIATSTIARYEKGQISKIKLPIIEAISRYLGINPAWVLGKSNVKFEKDLKKSKPLTNKEQHILNKYKNLNYNGQQKAEAYIDDLLVNPKYTAAQTAPQNSISGEITPIFKQAVQTMTDIKLK